MTSECLPIRTTTVGPALLVYVCVCASCVRSCVLSGVHLPLAIRHQARTCFNAVLVCEDEGG
jgi:hypothetical protein